MLLGAGSQTSINLSEINGNYGMTTYYDPVSMTSSAARGGGIYVSGFGDAEPTSLSMTSSVMDKNVVMGDLAMGGAIQSGIAASLRIEGSELTNNSAAGDGGAISLSSFTVDSDASLTLLNSMVSGNSAGDDGGAIEASFGTYTLIDGSIISDNYASDRGGGVYAAGNYDPDTQPIPAETELTIVNSFVLNNTSLDDGGGVHAGEATTLLIDNSEISGNSAGEPEDNPDSFVAGGGVRVSFANDAASSATISNSLISGNFTEDDAAGLYTAQSFEVDIINFAIPRQHGG